MELRSPAAPLVAPTSAVELRSSACNPPVREGETRKEKRGRLRLGLSDECQDIVDRFMCQDIVDRVPRLRGQEPVDERPGAVVRRG